MLRKLLVGNWPHAWPSRLDRSAGRGGEGEGVMGIAVPRGQRMALAAVVSVALAAAMGASARAAPPGQAVACPLGMTGTAHAAPAGGVAYTVCTGRVPSFDGTPLDTDLTLPAGARVPLPLVVMLHGWGLSKTDFEASGLAGNGTNTWHWNNVWFAAHGYAVLNYTARGFHRSCGQDPSSGYSYTSDPACQGKASWTHLADRRWEIHDTQYLAGLLVDAGIADPAKVVVTGDSYGGGQSWLLALSRNKVMLPDGGLVPWQSPAGVPIRLAAAVPQFGWSDLAQALTDNGRASDATPGAPPPGPHESPWGGEAKLHRRVVRRRRVHRAIRRARGPHRRPAGLVHRHQRWRTYGTKRSAGGPGVHAAGNVPVGVLPARATAGAADSRVRRAGADRSAVPGHPVAADGAQAHRCRSRLPGLVRAG